MATGGGKQPTFRTAHGAPSLFQRAVFEDRKTIRTNGGTERWCLWPAPCPGGIALNCPRPRPPPPHSNARRHRPRGTTGWRDPPRHPPGARRAPAHAGPAQRPPGLTRGCGGVRTPAGARPERQGTLDPLPMPGRRGSSRRREGGAGGRASGPMAVPSSKPLQPRAHRAPTTQREQAKKNGCRKIAGNLRQKCRKLPKDADLNLPPPPRQKGV